MIKCIFHTGKLKWNKRDKKTEKCNTTLCLKNTIKHNKQVNLSKTSGHSLEHIWVGRVFQSLADLAEEADCPILLQ